MSLAFPASITYPEHLPVTQRREDIAAAIRDSQVVIVAGETGSGKTTQLPKICLELGRGQGRGVIGHTQPRRIAARTVAERIAEELGTALGDVVGYKVRFTDRSSEKTTVKVMTDGILLAEIQRDRDLRRYDTIIIDEAHERSLNIDFILGYLKRLLPRRPDLKVIITSATIDPERFAAHFGGAPVIEVSGRMYPVEVRYRELVDDQTQGVTDGVRELLGEGPGDILVFLSGEREIRDAADALQKLKPARVGDAFDVLPLYSRLSSAEQHRVFAPHSTRRVILATNVAETSLTVPGVRFVIDTGLARISRFSARTKVQRLPIEPISRASANQRKGRCGRVADGICIRLYAEEDFDARPEFTDPEILRTNLASVILQMISLGLGDVARFPFMEPPDTRSIQSGVQVLEEIGAIHTPKKPRLTPLGKKLAQLPVDPRLARMIVEADSNGCLREVITVTAALSIQDPRERPTEQQELADSKHRRFTDQSSDFAGMLNLWRFVKDQQAELSSSAFRRLCKADFLNYLRIREWQDLDAQLRQVCKQLGLNLSRTPSGAEAIHRSLLAGLLSQIGMKDVEKRDYLGARGTRFSIFPGSALAKKQPDFVMSAELVHTSRLWGRVNAGIDPAWAESAGAHLVRRSYSEPHWEKKRGAVMALEKVTLYGVPIVSERKVNYGRIDPEVARELFIRHALVQGEWTTQHPFFHANARVLEEAGELEERARRRDIVVDDETLFAFYDARVGADVVSAAHFDTWWKATRRKDPELLTWTFDTVVQEAADDVSPGDFPDVWRSGESELPLRYQFDPGTEDDGVTVDIPVASLHHVEAAEFSWPVPGLRTELVLALIRSLPKRLRVNFVPAPEYAKAFLAAATPGEDLLLAALERYLLRTTGVVVQRSDWDLEKIPRHLRPSFRVVTETGGVLGHGKDLEELKQDLRSSADVAVSSAGAAMERRSIAQWDFGEMPRTFTQTRAGHEVKGYPALVDEGDSVAIKVLGTAAEQTTSMRAGLRRLLMLAVPSPAAGVLRRLSNADKLVLGVNPHGSVAALLDDCYAAAVDVVVDEEGGPVWDEAGMNRLTHLVRSRAPAVLDEVVTLVSAALAAAHDIDRRLSGRAELAMLSALTDLKSQWSSLVFPGFVADAGREHLRHYPRYFAAMGARLDRLASDPRRDATLMASMAGVQSAYSAAVSSLAQGTRPDGALLEVRWMLEELRVSLWAQHLKTPRPISVQRVERALREI